MGSTLCRFNLTVNQKRLTFIVICVYHGVEEIVGVSVDGLFVNIDALAKRIQINERCSLCVSKK